MRGKATKKTTAAPKGQDHPRLCGEKAERMGFAAMHVGSPPPMRGKVVSTIGLVVQLGITPAYAGKR